MQKQYQKARAKINLVLFVKEKREDGYHNIETIFQKISLYDELWIEETKEAGFSLSCNKKELETKENILEKAYEELKKQNPQLPGVTVKLIKHIPMQAGLGGGSADAASFLKAMNQLFKLNQSNQDLEKIAVKLGADVPACLYEGTLKAEGIGEKLTPIQTKLPYWLLIIKPMVDCCTKKMYQKLDEKTNRVSSTITAIQTALQEENLEKMLKEMQNDFETALLEEPQIWKIKEKLQQTGASKTLLAGSGSCVIGFYLKKSQAKQAYQQLKPEYEIYFSRPYYVWSKT